MIEALELLKQPAPYGFKRMARIDDYVRQPDWCGLPTPTSDSKSRNLEERFEGRLYQWSEEKWQCAACIEHFDKWWPDYDLRYNIDKGAKLRIIDVPEDECVHCGTQYVFNPEKARYLQ